MESRIITTARLELCAGNSGIARAELHDREQFADLLGAEVPAAWPPPLVDEQALRYVLEFYEGHPHAEGFGTWYVLLPDLRGGRPACIGVAGFKGEPAADGTIEIGYSLLEEFQRRGYATEAVSALVAWAFAHPEVRRVIAETLPDLFRCFFRVPSVQIDAFAAQRVGQQHFAIQAR